MRTDSIFFFQMKSVNPSVLKRKIFNTQFWKLNIQVQKKGGIIRINQGTVLGKENRSFCRVPKGSIFGSRSRTRNNYSFLNQKKGAN